MITEISAALSSLKTATEIAKFIRESNFSLENAELKLKVAELISSLADVKIELAELQELLADKDKKITELERAFDDKKSLARHMDAYYETDEAGAPKGAPYCARCLDANHKKSMLVTSRGPFRVCPICNTQYHFGSVPTI